MKKQKSIKGQDHHLAYITAMEAAILRAFGGGVTETGGQRMSDGVPAYAFGDGFGEGGFGGFGGGFGADSGFGDSGGFGADSGFGDSGGFGFGDGGFAPDGGFGFSSGTGFGPDSDFSNDFDFGDVSLGAIGSYGAPAAADEPGFFDNVGSWLERQVSDPMNAVHAGLALAGPFGGLLSLGMRGMDELGIEGVAPIGEYGYDRPEGAGDYGASETGAGNRFGDLDALRASFEAQKAAYDAKIKALENPPETTAPPEGEDYNPLMPNPESARSVQYGLPGVNYLRRAIRPGDNETDYVMVNAPSQSNWQAIRRM